MNGKTISNFWRIDLLCIVLIFLISFPAIKNLLLSGFFQTHDGDWHIAHVYWFDQAIKQGHFPVRWVDEINRGRGYPFFNFYYPLLYYLTEIPYFLGFGLVNSLKLILVLSFPLSGIAMYMWVRQLWGKWAGLVAAILLMYAPYRFVAVYVAARLGETVAFVFIPLALAAITAWIQTGKQMWLGMAALCWAGLILSHNIQALVFSPFILVYMLVAKRGKYILGVTLFALGVAAYFWLPALVEKTWTMQGQKVAYDFRDNFPLLKAYFYQPWGYGLNTTGEPGGVSLQLGLAQWGALGLAIFCLRKKELLPKFLLIWVGMTFLLMNKISLPAWELLPLLPQIQIPSRLLGMVTFLSAALAGWSAKQNKLLAAGLVMLAIYSNRNYLRPGYFERYLDDNYADNQELLYGTIDPYAENMPVWSRFNADTFEDKIIVDPRSPVKPQISNVATKPRKYSFEVDSPDYAWIKIRSLYYPGWKLLVDGKEQLFQFEHAYGLDELGYLQVSVPAGKHDVEIYFGETNLRKMANAISFLALAAVGLTATKTGYKTGD